MTEAKKDAIRALAAAKEIVDGRNRPEASAILMTLEHTIATVLLSVYPNPKIALGMLNEALVQGVEARISLFETGKYPI